MTCSSVSVFASSNVSPSNFIPYLQTNSGYYWYNYNGTSSTITNGTKLTDLIGQLGGNLTQTISYIYTRIGNIVSYVDNLESYVDGLEGYVDGIEGTLNNINNKLPSSTWFDNIKSYIDGIEGYIDGLEGYVDGIEGSINTSNTNLSNILNAINSISTYDYSTVLDNINTNTGYLSPINTYIQSIQESIGYGSSLSNLQTKLSSMITSLGNIKTDTGNIYNVLNTLPKSFNFVHPSRSSVTGNASMTVNHTPTYMSWFGTPESRVYAWVSDTTVSSTFDYLGVINNNLNFLGSALYTINTSYQSDRYDGRGVVAGYNKVYSLLDALIFGFNDLNKMIDKLSFVLADDDTIAAKRANASQTTAVLSNYTGNGSASASVADFGDIKDSVGSVKSGLNTNVSVSNIFNIFNNNDGYGFWSDDTRNELNSTGSNRNNLKARGVSDTPLYDAKISELYNAMGVKHE